jgi:hypothetical protein
MNRTVTCIKHYGRSQFEDNIKMDIRGTDCEDINWIMTGQSDCALLMKLQKQHDINMEGCGILKYS